MCKNLGKIFITLLLVIIALMPGVLLDVTYYGKINCIVLTWIVEGIKQCGYECNVGYTQLFNFLNEQFGILITTLSIMISISVNLANRDENRVYGIQRQNLESEKKRSFYRVCTRAVFLAPPLMFMVINLRMTITGYSILVWCYVFLGYSYFKFHKSFDKKRDRDKMADVLIECSKSKGIGVDTYRQSLLDSVYNSTEKEKSWDGAAQLYEAVIDKCNELQPEQKFSLAYHFFDTVFMRTEIGMKHGEEYLTKYIMKLMGKDIFDEGEYTVLWAMLYCIFGVSGEEKIIRLLKWSIDLPQNWIGDTIYSHVIELENYDKWLSLLLLQTEHWMQKNTIKNDNIATNLSCIWNHGKRIFEERYEKVWTQCGKLVEPLERRKMEQVHMDDSIRKLYCDYKYGYGRSIIYNVVRSMKGGNE